MPLTSPSPTPDTQQQQQQQQSPLPLLQAQNGSASAAALDSSFAAPHQQHTHAHTHGALPPRPNSPTAKRQRISGFSSGPIPPSLDGATLQGVQQGAGSLASAGATAAGSALLSPSVAEGGELHPPPLDAEELFEHLQVPVHIADRARPPLLPPLIPSQQPSHSNSDAHQPPLGPHGEPTQMEIIFALGVYDRDWVAAGKRASKGRGSGYRHRGRKLGRSCWAECEVGGSEDSDGGEEEVWECPLSPLDHPPETYSPMHPELRELEAEAETRRLQQHQQRQLQQQGLLQGQGVGADGIPMVMDLRARATAAGHLGSYSTFSAAGMSGAGSGFMDLDPSQPALLTASTTAHAAHVVHSQGAIPEVSMDDAWQANGVQGNGNAHTEPQEDPDIVEWTRSMPQDYPETWDEPDESFESFVSETVRYRLGKYVTLPDVASRVPSEDCHNLSRKIKREVIQKEKEAFEGRRVQGLFKLIERKKVQHNLYEFVRHSCKRWHAHKAKMKAQQQQQQEHSAS